MTSNVETSADTAPESGQIRVERPRRGPRLNLSGTFGPASELPYRRRISDWIRLFIAIGFVVYFADRVNTVSQVGEDVLDIVQSMPHSWHGVFNALYSIAALWALGLIVAAALIGKRWRLARDLTIAGLLSWLIARGLGQYFEHSRSFTSSFNDAFGFGDAAHFPVPRLALVVAVVSVASPYLTRPTRRVGQLVVGLLAVSAMYIGAGYPNDVAAAIFLGWGVAAAVHLVFKSPGGRPTALQVQQSLLEMGVTASDVRLEPDQPDAFTLMTATKNDGTRLTVKVFGRDEANAQFLAKSWRFIAYKESGPSLVLNRRQQVEHEAYVLLFAAMAGARVPAVEAAGTAGPGAALLVIDAPDGPVASTVDAAEMTDALLDDIWNQVELLQGKGVAHGAMNLDAVILTPEGPMVRGFGSSVTSASAVALGSDVAEMLVSMSSVVGEDRAMASAVRVLSKDSLVGALPLLQPQALTRDTRHGHKRGEVSQRLTKLRELLSAATDTPPPLVFELHRVSPANLGMAIGTLLAVAVLLTQVGDPQEVWSTLQSANWLWVLVAFLLVMSTTMSWAIAFLGSVPIRLSYWSVTELQVATNFAQMAAPGVGPLALQVRYLQKQGMEVSNAVATGGLLATTAMIVTQIGVFIVAASVSPTSFKVSNIPVSSLIVGLLIVVAALLVLVAMLMWVPKLRRDVWPKVAEAAAVLWQVVRSPGRVALLIGGNIITALLYGACYVACLSAFGGHMAFSTLVAANIVVGTLAGLIPIPGGSTAVGAVGMSGLMTAAGVPSEIAVSTVLIYQSVVSYLPGLPGWFATRDLLKRQYL